MTAVDKNGNLKIRDILVLATALGVLWGAYSWASSQFASCDRVSAVERQMQRVDEKLDKILFHLVPGSK